MQAIEVIAASMRSSQLVCLLLFLPQVTFAQQNIVLTSTLPDSRIVPPGQVIVFTCEARGATIVQWSSNEYINSGGHNIQILNSPSGMDVMRGSAHATLVNATVENGIPVLVSELRIMTSTQYPTATIQCDDNGHGSQDNITFVLQNITLTSTLTDHNMAYSRQELVFTCEARGATIVQWSSDEYINSGGHNVQILNSTSGMDVTRGSARAILVSAAIESGVLVLISMLFITVSSQYPMATIKCDDNGHGSKDNITFHLADSPPPTINSTLHEEKFACPGDEVRFKCMTVDSRNLVWTSETYFGPNTSLHFTYTSPINVSEESSGTYYAVLMSASVETGRIRLKSLLNIIVSESIRDQPQSITCLNLDIGTNTTTSFRLADSCEDSITTSTSTESGVESGNNDKSKRNLEILLGVIIPIAVAIVLFVIITTLCVRRAKHTDKHNSVHPCSCVDVQAVEAQCPVENDEKVEECQKPPPSSTISEKSPLTVTSNFMGSGQGDQNPMITTTLLKEDNTNAETASCTDIHMQDNSSAESRSNKDVPLQELTQE